MDADLYVYEINTYNHGNGDINFTANGYIYNDNKKRFDDGDCVETSSIIMIDFEKKILKTRNTTYRLLEEQLWI